MPRKTATVNAEESAPSVQEAENDLQAKREHYADLNARLGRGDSSVSLDEWREAGLAIEFHEKRLEGAKAVAAVEAEKDRRAAIFDLRRKARKKYAKDTAEIASAFDDALAAIRRVAQAVIDYNSHQGETSATARQLRPAGLDPDQKHPEQHLYTFSGVSRLNATDVIGAAIHTGTEGLKGRDGFGPSLVAPPPGAVEAVKRLRQLAASLAESDDDGKRS